MIINIHNAQTANQYGKHRPSRWKHWTLVSHGVTPSHLWVTLASHPSHSWKVACLGLGNFCWPWLFLLSWSRGLSWTLVEMHIEMRHMNTYDLYNSHIFPKCSNSASGLELSWASHRPVAVSLRLDGPGPTGPKGFRAIAWLVSTWKQPSDIQWYPVISSDALMLSSCYHHVIIMLSNTFITHSNTNITNYIMLTN